MVLHLLPWFDVPLVHLVVEVAVRQEDLLHHDSRPELREDIDGREPSFAVAERSAERPYPVVCAVGGTSIHRIASTP